MSIIIEDMIMPKSCVACPFEHNGDCYGGKPKLIMDIEDFNFYRHPNCPLKEVVRCKDCKRYTPFRSIQGEEMGEGECEGYDPCVPANHYCSRGKRKNGQGGRMKEFIIACKNGYQYEPVGEVVRCRECVHFVNGGWCKLHDTGCEQTDYCSGGAQKHEVEE